MYKEVSEVGTTNWLSPEEITKINGHVDGPAITAHGTVGKDDTFIIRNSWGEGSKHQRKLEAIAKSCGIEVEIV